MRLNREFSGTSTEIFQRSPVVAGHGGLTHNRSPRFKRFKQSGS